MPDRSTASQPEALIPSAGRARQFANCLDSLMASETEDMRWLRNAADRMRANPEIYGENQ